MFLYYNLLTVYFRWEDYAANRKGAGASTGLPGQTGLFGAPPNQTAPGAGTSLFGATQVPASQANTMFGAQAAKPGLFGATSTANTGFGAGAVASPFGATAVTTNTFGVNTSAGGGLFGAKQPGAFGAPTASSSGFNFGQTTATSSAAGSLFGQQQPKPFGAVAPQQTGNYIGTRFWKTILPFCSFYTLKDTICYKRASIQFYGDITLLPFNNRWNVWIYSSPCIWYNNCSPCIWPATATTGCRFCF